MREAHDAARGDSPENGPVAVRRKPRRTFNLQETATVVWTKPEKFHSKTVSCEVHVESWPLFVGFAWASQGLVQAYKRGP